MVPVGAYAIVTYPGPDRANVGELSQLVTWMEARPTEHGNILHPEKKREPTPQQKRHAEIEKMPMDTFLRERKRPGFYDPQ